MAVSSNDLEVFLQEPELIGLRLACVIYSESEGFMHRKSCECLLDRSELVSARLT